MMYGSFAWAEVVWSEVAESLTPTYEEIILSAATKALVTAPDDTPGDTPIEGRLATPPTFERSVINEVGIGGGASIGFGTVELENSDGHYDQVVSDYAIDGRRITLRLGEPSAEFGVSEFGIVFDGVASGWRLSEERVIIDLRDFGYELDAPAATNYFGGSGGMDGTADLAGKAKQRCWGVCNNVTGIIVDPLNSKVQFCDGELQAIDAVKDNGEILPDDGTYYTRDLASGCITMLHAIVGEITADIQGAKLGGSYVSKTADIVYAVLKTSLSWDDDRFDLVSISVLNTIQPAEIGYVISGEMTVRQVIADLLYGILGFYDFTRDGRFYVGRFGEPAGEVLASFGEIEIIEIERMSPPSSFYPPTWRQRVGYAKNWTVQTSGLATGLSNEVRLSLSQEYRYGEAHDFSVRDNFLRAQDAPPKPTYFALKADADAEALRLLAFYALPRGFYRIVVKVQPLTLNNGPTVGLKYPRWDLKQGRKVVVCSVRDDLDNNQVQLKVYT